MFLPVILLPAVLFVQIAVAKRARKTSKTVCQVTEMFYFAA